MRWKIENEGFNTQKKHGYGLEHLYSKNYQALKNHYYLLQIGHMISQCMEAWEKIWKKVKQSLEQKHRKLLECMKETPLEEHKDEMERKIQIRFIQKPFRKGGGKESGGKQKEEKQGIGILWFKIRIDRQLSIKNRIPFALGE